MTGGNANTLIPEPVVTTVERGSDPAPEAEPPVANEVPRVLLTTPHYGGVSMGLLNTIRLAVRDRSLVTLVGDSSATNSVLPQTFNTLLATALDLRDAGRVTHLAMCHSDILAERGWVDTLWSEMWYHKADVMAAIPPIKRPSGRTSTAVGVESDPWVIRRSVWLKDRKTLPETFGPEHVCGPGEVLLVNTGLWLADLRRPWWDDFAFQFHCRIRKTPDGRVADHRSEDWEMSHHLHRHKARVMATWKVKLRHEGLHAFPNYDDDWTPK